MAIELFKYALESALAYVGEMRALANEIVAVYMGAIAYASELLDMAASTGMYSTMLSVGLLILILNMPKNPIASPIIKAYLCWRGRAAFAAWWEVLSIDWLANGLIDFMAVGVTISLAGRLIDWVKE